ncbi:unnamed protein product [Owenia fusiformis]|uniref:Uncharacterized protein n=1 Tax=Owenia fusiformis TaxID=6347 RepID=A0A8S4N3X0_OWEFU|nr:unnamed protein product [Owenia fusiformis]
MAYADNRGTDDPPQEFYDHSLKLWTDSGTQEAYCRSSEYQLIDSAKYFLDQIETIRREDYIPTDQDILRCRVITTGISKIDFTLKDAAHDVNFSVYDVGGQQGERRKWIQVFESCTAVLFVADMSSFDLQLREDSTRNRLIESLDTFKQTWNNRFLKNVSIILFLNKMDILEEKVNSGTSLQTLADKISEDSPYYAHLQNFKSYTPSDDEVREFVDAQPANIDTSGPKSNDNTTRPRSRSRGSSISRKADINLLNKTIPNPEVIKTAAFIKNMYMAIVHDERRMSVHDSHFCRYFYTCAVDTDNVRKVLEGCRSIIIQTWLDKIFVLG